jgi:5-methylcytosine-specific restriction enzyme B
MELELDSRIVDELKAKYKSLQDEGKLLSNEQLENYYSTFRSRFGPDKLKNIDGEELLNLMHDMGNKESLVYWLEFKDDDEFHSNVFGSIAGGSSFKFGLFRKKETQLWTTGSPQKPISLSIDEAIMMAKRNRDQLLQGVKLLEKMPINGTDEDYEQLQQDMNHAAPDVSDLAWGHKYFHLLFPEKLDDFHNPDYQRFHLIKLLQLPPQGEGRYIAGSRFVAIANELKIPMYHLTSMLNIRDGGTPYSYWRIGTSGDAPRNRWELMRDGNCVAIGWGDIGDLTEITNDNAGKEQIFQLLLARDPQVNRSAARRAAQQIFNFRWAITENDLVLASDGAAVLGIGRVTDDYDYKYDPSSDFPHRRPVEWLSLEEWQQPDQQPGIEGKLTTVYKMKRDANLLEAEKRIYGKEPIIITTPPGHPAEPTTQQLSTLPRLSGIPARIQAILERKGQIILYGPPGTGKTYWAEKAAHELAARSNFRKMFEQLKDEQKALVLGTGDQPGGMVRMCSFHPAYGYEDFLEGFRPEPVNGQMQFILRDGIFKKLCNDAGTQPDHKFYLIIDEINRGDIPRIFGELLTVLEKDKRGKSILLPLTGRQFRVPVNIFIIGTMNTADRSIALLDTALRRRFGFIELMPDISILGDTMVDEIPLGLWLKSLNERICEYVGRDARNLQIGHSYLLEKGRPAGDFATFAKILREDILPLLEEYCYEDYATLEKILGSSLIDGQKQQVRQELFDSSNRSLLVQALLAPTPDMITSMQALSSAAQAVDEEEEEHDEDSEDEQP